MGQVQYISDENNNITAVIVPIDLWHELQSEKETAYLLKRDHAGAAPGSPAAKNRHPVR